MRISISFLSIVLLLTVLTACGRKQERQQAQPAPKDTVAVVKRPVPPTPPPEPPKPAVVPKRLAKPVAKKGSIKEEDLPRYVQALQPKIQRLYKSKSQIVPMQGSVRIAVVFASSGDVKSVKITPDEKSSFTDAFLKEVEDIVVAWHLDVEKEMDYSFRMSFYQ